jgi:hypothetical protein
VIEHGQGMPGKLIQSCLGKVYFGSQNFEIICVASREEHSLTRSASNQQIPFEPLF